MRKLELEKQELSHILKSGNGGKELEIEKTVNLKELKDQQVKSLEKQNLNLQEEVNRLRLKYENEFSA